MNTRKPVTRLKGWTAAFGAALLLSANQTLSETAPGDGAVWPVLSQSGQTGSNAGTAGTDADSAAAQASSVNSSPGNDRESSADASSAEVAELTPVVVTGSHIRRSEIEGPQPVDVITPDLVERVGGVKLGDYLPYLTTNQFPTDSVGHMFGSLDTRVGTSNFNLRGLGADATLTLINGHRVAPYGNRDGESFVNIDTIPLAAIDRVEILKDGASAIYGADAVAGVVNIILNDRYEGVDVSASYLETEDGGGNENSIDLIAGDTFGATNVTAAFGWYDLDPIYARQRDFIASADYSWRGGYDDRSFFSSPPTALMVEQLSEGPRWLPDPECPQDRILVFVPGEDENCLYDTNETMMASTGTERYSGLLFVTHDFSPTLTLRAEAGYDRFDVDRILAPQPVVNFEASDDSVSGLPIVPAENPYNPFGEDVEILFRLAPLDPRDISHKTTGRRILTELEWLTESWRWRGYASWSDSRTDYETKNVGRIDRLQPALLGQGGPTGDQWFNPFGLNPTNDPELLDWIRATREGKSDTRERTVGLITDGTLFALPSGPLALAVGAEWRDQNYWQTADPLTLQGALIDNEWLPFNADRDIRAAFAELSIPVLNSVEIQLAGRLEDYSDFGSEFSPKVAMAWRPRSTVLVRASYSESFLPPNFRELYDPVAEGFARYDDSVRCPITDDPLDCSRFFRPILTGGNPNLEAETADTWYAGFVWSPEILEGLDLEIGYWSFEFDDRVWVPTAQFVVDNSGTDSTLVTRADPTPEDEALGAPGRIESVHVGSMNLSKDETSGIDFALRYAFAPTRFGSFTIGATGTYVDEVKVTLPPNWTSWDDNGENLAGTSEYWGSGQPEWRIVSSLDWQLGNTGASAVMTYFDSYDDWANYPDETNRDSSDREHSVGSWTSVDLQVSQTFPALMDGRVSLGCINCFDEEPPLYFGGFSGVDLGLHDIRGRSWYARWSQPFGGGRRD